MKTVLGYLRPHAGRVAAGAAIKFTAAVLELILPLLLAEIIDELVPAGDTAAIWRTGGWMSLLALGAVGCNITANRMAAWVSMEMTRVLRQDLYRRIQGLSCTQQTNSHPPPWCPASPMTPTMSTRCLTRSSGAASGPPCWCWAD